MAQKRMFDKRVVDTDKFIDLPNSTKALYFMAGMSADDKGFFQPRKLQKICGFTDDDFKILIAKNYFIVFESGVMVVTDWNKNNWLDSRRISETEYVEELKLLRLVNEKYEFNDEEKTIAKRMLSENSIEENSIDQNRVDNIYSPAEAEQCEVLPATSNQSATTNLFKEIIDYLNLRTGSDYKYTTKSTQSKINARLNEGFTLDDFKVVIDKKCDDWLESEMSKYLRPETLFGTKFESYLNQPTKEIKEEDLPNWFDKDIEKDTRGLEALNDILKDF